MENTAVPGGTVAADETLNLISADKVVGTSVYNRQGEKLGSVYTLMLNKLNGQGGLCRHVVRRLSRYRGELPPLTLAHPELRYGSGRVHGGSRSPPAGRRADLYPSRGARLAYLSRAHRRLLRHPAGLTGGEPSRRRR